MDDFDEEIEVDARPVFAGSVPASSAAGWVFVHAEEISNISHAEEVDDFEDVQPEETEENFEEEERPRKRPRKPREDPDWIVELDTFDEDLFKETKAKLEKAEAGNLRWLGRKRPRQCGKDKMECLTFCPFLREPGVLCPFKRKHLIFNDGRRMIMVMFCFVLLAS